MPAQITSLAENSTLLETKPTLKRIKKVAFLGGAAWKETDQIYLDAYETARLLAQNGYEIVNGGGPGVMKASTMGAKSAGGKTLAVTYHPNKPKRHYEGVDLTNLSDEEVFTLDYFDRTKVMLQNSDLHIVYNGSLGTLSELGMTWISSWIHEPNHKPIILFGDCWKEVVTTLKKCMLITDQETDLIHFCDSPQEVLAYIHSLG